MESIDSTPPADRELILLERIEDNPDVTQASLADLLGVAVGTVNWHLKRLVAKGYVKVKRAQRRKLKYIITPEGLAFRAALAVHYIETSMRLYRKTRQQVSELLIQARQMGYDQVYLDGDGDIADICRLTCLEQNFRLAERPSSGGPVHIPALEVRDTEVLLRLDDHLPDFGVQPAIAGQGPGNPIKGTG
jgi:DNA-binding MarR family transcriptional regulator